MTEILRTQELGQYSNSSKRIVMVGAFPPPIYGMAAVNAAVRERLCALRVPLVILNVSAASLSRSIFSRLRRIPKVIAHFIKLALLRKSTCRALYISVSGGPAQLYEIIFITIARLKSTKIFLHHHSYSYLNKYSTLTQCLVYAAGIDAVHVTLSQRMREQLKKTYGVQSTEFVSNSVFLSKKIESNTIEKGIQTIGFLSNISPEKGISDFLELCRLLADKRVPVRAILAGPFQDKRVEMQVRLEISNLPNLEYIGPVFGKEKEEFYKKIDVLVFPTRYSNEAEPVTLYEAMSQCVPVIAYGRGCIPEILTPDCGLVINPGERFSTAALAQLENWIADQKTFENAALSAFKRFDIIYRDSCERWDGLLAKLLS